MIRRAAFFGVSLLLACQALAHTKLDRSTPAADAAVEPPVAEIVLEFVEPVRLTVVTLVDSAGAAKRLSAVPTDTAARFVIEVREPLAAGEHVIAWRAVGADTHIVSGDIPFRVVDAAHAH